MALIKKSDLRQITYGEFGEMLAKLENQVVNYCKENEVKFDLIVPILRSGAFSGFHLASKLSVSNILPAQYKYEYEPSERCIKKFEFPELLFELPDSPNILITDSNTVWGGIAEKVIKDVKKKYPSSKVFFASANLDQSISKVDGIEQVFWGELSNEKRELTPDQAKDKGITNDIIIFPWEDLEEQWYEINTSQQQYES